MEQTENKNEMGRESGKSKVTSNRRANKLWNCKCFSKTVKENWEELIIWEAYLRL